MTIRDFFDSSAREHPQRPAQIFHDGGKWTKRSYAELRERVTSLAYGIGMAGFAPRRDNVAIIAENSPRWLETYLALAATGITAVPIDPKLKIGEMLYILEDCTATLVFAGKKQLESLLASEAFRRLKCRVSSIDQDLPRPGSISYDGLLESGRKSPLDRDRWFDRHRPKDGDIASLIYTSGTTGSPKGVMLSHGNFTSDAIAAIDAVSFCKKDVFLAVLPFFHTFSFTGNFLIPLAKGGCTAFIRSVKTLAEDMKQISPSVLLAVPLLAEKLHSKIAAKINGNPFAKALMRMGLGKAVGKSVVASLGGKLRFIGIGGAAADRDVLRGFCKLGIPVLEGYGLTECSPLVAYPRLESFRPGSVGRVLPCMEYKIADKDASGAGELCVKGPNVMTGYYNRPEMTSAAFDEEGFLHTGDVVRSDEEGNLYICGRRKAMVVNREGKNIYPEEIEQAISSLPYLSGSLALGYSVGGETGERIGLMVEANEEACLPLGKNREEREKNLLAEIMRICHERLAEYKIPRKIVLRREPFILTSTMKIKRVAYCGALDE